MCREGEEHGQCRAPESICPALGLTAEIWDSTYGSQWIEEKEMKKAKTVTGWEDNPGRVLEAKGEVVARVVQCV